MITRTKGSGSPGKDTWLKETYQAHKAAVQISTKSRLILMGVLRLESRKDSAIRRKKDDLNNAVSYNFPFRKVMAVIAVYRRIYLFYNNNYNISAYRRTDQYPALLCSRYSRDTAVLTAVSLQEAIIT